MSISIVAPRRRGRPHVAVRRRIRRRCKLTRRPPRNRAHSIGSPATPDSSIACRQVVPRQSPIAAIRSRQPRIGFDDPHARCVRPEQSDRSRRTPPSPRIDRHAVLDSARRLAGQLPVRDRPRESAAEITEAPVVAQSLLAHREASRCWHRLPAITAATESGASLEDMAARSPRLSGVGEARWASSRCERSETRPRRESETCRPSRLRPAV